MSLNVFLCKTGYRIFLCCWKSSVMNSDGKKMLLTNLLSWFPPQWQNVSRSGIWSPTPTRLEGMRTPLTACVKHDDVCRVRGGAKCILCAKCSALQAHPTTHSQTQIKLHALYMRIRKIMQLSTHLCCHGSEPMKRRGGQRREGGGKEKLRHKWTVLEVKKISIFFRCPTNLPSTLTPQTPSVQVSHSAVDTGRCYLSLFHLQAMVQPITIAVTNPGIKEKTVTARKEETMKHLP